MANWALPFAICFSIARVTSSSLAFASCSLMVGLDMVLLRGFQIFSRGRYSEPPALTEQVQERQGPGLRLLIPAGQKRVRLLLGLGARALGLILLGGGILRVRGKQVLQHAANHVAEGQDLLMIYP